MDLRYHACEVLSKDHPWIARFVGYRPLPVIPEALEYGHYNMRVIEVWFRNMEDYFGGTSMFHFTWKGGWMKNPIELDKYAIPRFRPVSGARPERLSRRQIQCGRKNDVALVYVHQYPEGVSVEEGDDWFVNVHSKEVLQQPGLIGYFSAKAVQFPGRSAPPGGVRANSYMKISTAGRNQSSTTRQNIPNRAGQNTISIRSSNLMSILPAHFWRSGKKPII